MEEIYVLIAIEKPRHMVTIKKPFTLNQAKHITSKVMAKKSLEEKTKTTIDRSAITRTEKRDGWMKAVNQQLIADEVRIEAEKSTLSQQQLIHHDEEVERLSNDAKMIRTMSVNNMFGLGAKIAAHSKMSVVDHKNAQDAIDKASITLKVSDRHANGAVINNAVQAVAINKEDYAAARQQMMANDDC